MKRIIMVVILLCMTSQAFAVRSKGRSNCYHPSEYIESPAEPAWFKIEGYPDLSRIDEYPFFYKVGLGINIILGILFFIGLTLWKTDDTLTVMINTLCGGVLPVVFILYAIAYPAVLKVFLYFVRDTGLLIIVSLTAYYPIRKYREFKERG